MVLQHRVLDVSEYGFTRVQNASGTKQSLVDTRTNEHVIGWYQEVSLPRSENGEVVVAIQDIVSRHPATPAAVRDVYGAIQTRFRIALPRKE